MVVKAAASERSTEGVAILSFVLRSVGQDPREELVGVAVSFIIA